MQDFVAAKSLAYHLFMAESPGMGITNPHVQAGLLFALRDEISGAAPGGIIREVTRWNWSPERRESVRAWLEGIRDRALAEARKTEGEGA